MDRRNFDKSFGRIGIDPMTMRLKEIYMPVDAKLTMVDGVDVDSVRLVSLAPDGAWTAQGLVNGQRMMLRGRL